MKLSKLFAASMLALCVSLIASPAYADPPPTDEIDMSASDSATSVTSNFAYQGLTTALRWIDLNTRVQVNEPGSWFVSQVGLMFQVAIWILLPLFLISLIHSVIKGSLADAMRTTLIYLPLSIIGSVIAIQVVQLMIDITDDLSAVFLNELTIDLNKFGYDLLEGFKPDTVQAPRFIVILLGLMMGMASIAVLIILVMREAAIYIATLFLPIMFACLVWPVAMKYFRTMVEFFFSIIFCKVLIVAALSLVVAGLASTQGIDSNSAVVPAGTSMDAGTTFEAGSKDWILRTITFTLMMFFASFSPVILKGMIGQMGMGGAQGEITGAALTRPQAQPWWIGAARIQAIKQRAAILTVKRPNIFKNS